MSRERVFGLEWSGNLYGIDKVVQMSLRRLETKTKAANYPKKTNFLLYFYCFCIARNLFVVVAVFPESDWLVLTAWQQRLIE